MEVTALIPGSSLLLAQKKGSGGGGKREQLGTRLGSWAFYDLNFLRSALINPQDFFVIFRSFGLNCISSMRLGRHATVLILERSVV